MNEIISRDLSPIELECTFLIGDTHFDHRGIIDLCHRPFQNKRDMNRFMLRRWNETVGKDDTVFFLGDLVFGKKSKAASTWLRHLNGNIIFIQGNHDKEGLGITQKVITLNGLDFLFVHNPDTAQFLAEWDGWTIHAHKHNNDPINFPFINGVMRTINVSVEMIGYRPLKISYLCLIKIEEIRYQSRLESQPVLF